MSSRKGGAGPWVPCGGNADLSMARSVLALVGSASKPSRTAAHSSLGRYVHQDGLTASPLLALASDCRGSNTLLSYRGRDRGRDTACILP